MAELQQEPLTITVTGNRQEGQIPESSFGDYMNLTQPFRYPRTVR